MDGALQLEEGGVIMVDEGVRVEGARVEGRALEEGKALEVGERVEHRTRGCERVGNRV